MPIIILSLANLLIIYLNFIVSDPAFIIFIAVYLNFLIIAIDFIAICSIIVTKFKVIIKFEFKVNI